MGVMLEGFSGLVWLRIFCGQDYRKRKINRYAESIVPAVDVLRIMRNPGCKDVVVMDTGLVILHELAAPIPQWLSEPLTRQMALATGQIPLKIPSEPEWMI